MASQSTGGESRQQRLSGLGDNFDTDDLLSQLAQPRGAGVLKWLEGRAIQGLDEPLAERLSDIGSAAAIDDQIGDFLVSHPATARFLLAVLKFHHEGMHPDGASVPEVTACFFGYPPGDRTNSSNTSHYIRLLCAHELIKISKLPVDTGYGVRDVRHCRPTEKALALDENGTLFEALKSENGLSE